MTKSFIGNGRTLTMQDKEVLRNLPLYEAFGAMQEILYGISSDTISPSLWGTLLRELSSTNPSSTDARSSRPGSIRSPDTACSTTCEMRKDGANAQ